MLRQPCSRPLKSTSDIYNALGPYAFRDIELRQGSEYVAKMMHAIPDAKVVKDREAFIVERCKGKRVMNLGCASGALHGKIKAVATEAIGVDREASADIICDLDDTPQDLTDPSRWPGLYGAEIVVAGEIIEHLGNPGRLLQQLKKLSAPVIITVPNAFHTAGLRWMKLGYEQVNPDHISWFSWKTLKTLVERYGFAVSEFYWYNGQPLIAEGLIFLIN